MTRPLLPADVALRADAELGAKVRRSLAVTEKDFQRQVLDLAAIYRWSVYHPFLSKWSERGWPDLSMARPPRLVFAELKRDKAALTPDQQRWLELLRQCPGVEVYVWRPSQLDSIAKVLAS